MNFSSLLKRSALAAVLLAIAALPMSSGVKREVRSVWMATVWALDWPSSTSSTTAQKNEMVKYLDVLQKNNFNAVYFQVRTMSDAFYKSSYEPCRVTLRELAARIRDGIRWRLWLRNAIRGEWSAMRGSIRIDSLQEAIGRQRRTRL